MKRKNIYTSNVQKSCSPKRTHEELEPKPDLAYTPTDMARMHASGMPVNSANLINSFCDGEQNPSFDLSIERKRGMDMAEIWQASKDAQGKVKKLSRYVHKNKQSKKS